MELESVRRQDAGTYVCTANNGVGQEASAEIQVKIKCKLVYLLIDYRQEEVSTYLRYSCLRQSIC